MELTLVGLQYSGELIIANDRRLINNIRNYLIGKTTFVNVIAVSKIIQSKMKHPDHHTIYCKEKSSKK